MQVHRTLLTLFMSGALALPVMAQKAEAPTDNSTKGTNAQAGTSNMGKTENRKDRMFIEKAAAGGLLEVQLGQLAQQKGQSEDVKNFGKRMVDDHTKANDELKGIASSKGISVPDQLPAKEKAKVDKLSNATDFDKQYMSMMVKDHQKDVSDFQKEANSGTDPDVKNFASKTLPTLQDHLKMAQEINGKVGGKGGKPSAGKSEKKSKGM